MKICPKCNLAHDKPGVYCSRKCANSRSWTPEDKLKKSLSAKNSSSVLTANRYIGKANRKHEYNVVDCLNCGSMFKTKSQKFCCKECFDEFRRIGMEAYQAYKLDCKFIFNVYDYPDYFDLCLVESNGWYSASNRGNNLNGISRDHRLSVKDGFTLRVDPKIISHPANCQLVLQTDNARKNRNSSISLEQLLSEIELWKEKYGDTLPDR